MKVSYGAGDRRAGVRSFEIEGDTIILDFEDGKYRYVYDSEVPGCAHVEAMKRLALEGSGLTTYVSQHVRDKYARRVAIPAYRSQSREFSE